MAVYLGYYEEVKINKMAKYQFFSLSHNILHKNVRGICNQYAYLEDMWEVQSQLVR